MIGDSSLRCKGNNAARDTHRFINRWGLTWKVPVRSFSHMDANNEEIIVHYISPIDFVRYLLEKTPELVLGGHLDLEAGCNQLKSFWDKYEKFHPSHVLYKDHHPQRTRSNTLCMSLHGDEGRGVKKGNTAVLMFETNIGVETGENFSKKRRLDQCCTCDLRPNHAKRFKTNAGCMAKIDRDSEAALASFETHNTKSNSFLTKFVLAALPNSLYKDSNALEVLIKRICADFRLLFEGVEVKGKPWFVAVTGMKGDLKWYEKIACLRRCFNKQLGTDLEMCHECGAGSCQMPFEDAGHNPSWGTSIYQERPWDEVPDITLIPFEPEDGTGKPEMVLRRDIFHNTKVGLLRDYVGSAILLLAKLGYFNDPTPGASKGRPAQLERAHRSFYWWSQTVGRRPALRSFTKTFLNVKTEAGFGWISSKGSDTTLLIKWLKVISAGFMNDPLDGAHLRVLKHINLAAKCVLEWQSVMYGHGNWLRRHCAAVLYQELHDFLGHYNALAFFSLYTFQFTAFGMKSKFHMIAHAKHEIGLLLQDESVEFIPNLLMYGTEMNEDVVGKIARLSRRVSTRTMTLRTLQLYLAKCKAVHNRFRRQR